MCGALLWRCNTCLTACVCVCGGCDVRSACTQFGAKFNTVFNVSLPPNSRLMPPLVRTHSVIGCVRCRDGAPYDFSNTRAAADS